MASKIPLKERIGQALHVWRRLLPYVGAHKLKLTLSMLMTLVVVGAELAKPWPLSIVVDELFGKRTWKWLPAWIHGREHATELALTAGIAVLVFAVISGAATYWRDLWMADTGQRVVNRVRRHALERILLMSLAWHEKYKRGDLLLRLVSDAAALRMLLIEGLFSLMREGMIVLGTLAVMFWMDWQLALLSIAVMPMIGIMTTIAGVRLRRAARKQRLKEADLAASVHETMSAIPMIQAFGLEEEAADTFNRANRKSAKAGLAATRLEGRLGIGAETALALGIGLTLYYGAVRVAENDRLSPGDLLAMLTYIRAFYKPIRKALSRSAATVKAAAAGERMLELLDAVPDLPAPKNPKPLPHPRGEIELRSVSFRHGKDGRQVLRDASLRIAAGQHFALVGANGSGKTTVATLLPRLRDPNQGSVMIDGVDVREMDPAHLRRAIAMVFQETILFDATLRENILMGRPEATPAEVEAAAECAGVTTYSNRWPDGLDTKVGERGAGLSGGERQRVALARALVRESAIVVLDEPTTGLDAASEERLCSEVLARLRGRTVMLITHNPRLLAVVDRIVRIVDGRLVEVDRRTGEQLLSSTIKEPQ